MKHEQPLKKDLKPVRGRALLLQCVASFISTLLVFAMLRFYPDKQLALSSIGALHAVALLPALFFSGQYIVPTIFALLACILYPLWGYTSGFVFCGIGAPFMHSVIWGIVLCIALRRTAFIPYLIIVGLVTTVCMFLAMKYDWTVTRQSNEYMGFTASILSWHILMMFALPLVLRDEPKPWPYIWHDPRICRICGYSLVGLDHDAVCPECGHSR